MPNRMTHSTFNYYYDIVEPMLKFMEKLKYEPEHYDRRQLLKLEKFRQKEERKPVIKEETALIPDSGIELEEKINNVEIEK